MNPSCSRAASLMRDGSQGGSKTSSTSASFTPRRAEELAAHVVDQHRADAAAGGGERHLHAHLVAALDRLGVHRVDQPQLDDAGGDLRVVDGARARPTGAAPRRAPRPRPRAALVPAAGSPPPAPAPARRRPCRRSGPGAPMSVMTVNWPPSACCTTSQVPGGEEHALAARDEQRLDVARVWWSGCGSSLYSVETGSLPPPSACRSACQARLAHLTRAGNSWTPAKTASFPSRLLLAGPRPLGHQPVEAAGTWRRSRRPTSPSPARS